MKNKYQPVISSMTPKDAADSRRGRRRDSSRSIGRWLVAVLIILAFLAAECVALLPAS
jgi:hypothetical protein